MSTDETDASATDIGMDTEAGSTSGGSHASTDASTDAIEISYEAARSELGDVMRALESGGQSLEESLALWRRGEDLADICQRWLDDASTRLDEAIAARAERPATQ
ncbi:MAG: exodeoxyribonuclease small subunit [Pseudonocardiales bacterium]|nr:exodeoxyribonuclease small subunit [Pseudonocardiales bacterium]